MAVRTVVKADQASNKPYLSMAKAVHQMIVDNPGRLQEGIANGRTYERETRLLEGSADAVRQFR